MTHAPTDAMRLVPVKATSQQLETAAFNLSAEIGAEEAMKLGPHIELAYELLVAAAPASPLPEGGGVPADVARLVVAARRVAFENPSQSELRELDIASEAFASRVPWDDAPDEIPAAPTGAKT